MRTSSMALWSALSAAALTILAAPASADDVLEGVYVYLEDGAPPAEWLVSPVCTPITGDAREPLYLPAGCLVHVAVSQGYDAAHASQAVGVVTVPSGDARLKGGQWSYTTSSQDGLICPDGSTARATDTVIVDPVTLVGSRLTTWNNVCGDTSGSVRKQFTLTHEGPGPIPVNRYPLTCEPGGLRRCS
jgi:hypothetical protein